MASAICTGEGQRVTFLSPRQVPLCSSAPAASEGGLVGAGSRPQQRQAAPAQRPGRPGAHTGGVLQGDGAGASSPAAAAASGVRVRRAAGGGHGAHRPHPQPAARPGARGDRPPPRALRVDFSERCVAKQARQKQLFLILPANIFNHLFTLTKYASAFPILSVYKKNICFLKKNCKYLVMHLYIILERKKIIA